MNVASAIDKYLAACNTYQDAIDSFDEPDYRSKFQIEALKLESCFHELLQFAESNNPALWHVLGTAFNTGRGVKRNRQEAIRWFQRGAEAEHAPSMLNLGLCLMYPEPSLDAAGAIHWFRKSAEKGFAGGMVWLGFAYREGTGVPHDYDEAVQWFIKAVEAGDGHSMIHVGRIFAHYMSKPAQAVPWFLRAAEAGFSESFIELASLYDDRKSGVYNPAEAHKWYRVVAEHSEGTNSRALLALARQHLDGLGVPCDLKMAKHWLRRLLQAVPDKSSAHREASKLLKKLEDQLL